MTLATPRASMMTSLQGLLADLEARRGFLTDREREFLVSGDVDACGGAARRTAEDVPSVRAEHPRCAFWPSQGAAIPQDLPTVPERERAALLSQMAVSRAQLVGHVLHHPALMARLQWHDDAGRACVQALQATRHRWAHALRAPPALDASVTGAAHDAGLLLAAVFAGEGMLPDGQSVLLVTVLGDAGQAPGALVPSGMGEAFDAAILGWMKHWRAVRTANLEANARLVARWVHRHNRGLPHWTMLCIGMAGLARALDSFDPRREASLGTHASWWIRQRITRAVLNLRDPVRLPVHQGNLLVKLRRAQRQAWHPHRLPERALVLAADQLGLALEQAWTTANLGEATTDSRTPWGWEESPMEERVYHPATNPCQHLPDLQVLTQAADLWERILDDAEERFLRKTRGPQSAQRARDILVRRLGLEDGKGETLEQVGMVYGLTRERIRQLESQLLVFIEEHHGAAIRHLLGGSGRLG